MRRSLIGLIAGFAALCVVGLDSAHGSGLVAPTDRTLPPLRVTEHLVDVAVRDQIALTTVSQTFRNDTNQRLEAMYVFPLPDNADLTDFQMSFNGKMVQGEVLPADQARQIYESIVRQSRDPGLIEFIGTRLLQMRLFPIEPNSDTKIQVKYQQICKPISGMSGYHYPLRTAKASGQVYGTVRFSVKLETGAPLKTVWSPTHATEIVRQGEHKATIGYEASKGSLDDDFLLLFDTDSSDLGLSVIAHKPMENKPGHFVLTLTPKQLWPEQDYQPQDIVFVIDTSGSMAGEKIEQARNALKFCIDQLDDRDRFNLVRFSTGVDSLFEQLQPATAENRTKAKERIASLNAAGGTNITDALKSALDLRSVKREAASGNGGDEARPYVLVFLTDGIGNQPADHTMTMVKGHAAANGARIFTFGVGHDVNTIFLDQLATAHHAKPTYVQPGENLELALGDFFAVISQPVLTNLKITLPDIGVTERFPTSLSDLYHGQQLIIAGKFDQPMIGPITLTATRNGKQVEYAWPQVAFANTADARYVPAIWAGRKISFLIDQIRAHGENDEMVAEVMALSQEFGIQTPYSSWLVNPEQLPMQVRGRVPARRAGQGGPSGGGGAAPGAQLRALEAEGATVNQATPASDRDDYFYLGQDVRQESGADATSLAKRNAAMRESKSKDEGGRLNQDLLAARKIGERWYNRIGQFLVDDRLTEETAILTVKFGSDAYFALVNARPELRPVFAASPSVVVFVTESQAVMVSEDAGIEAFSADQVQHLKLDGRI